MNFIPVLLNDTKLHHEIFNLRVHVWENSCFSDVVNRKLFPDGWSDDLDSRGEHIVVFNNSNDIVASARLNFFDTPRDLPFFDRIKTVHLPQDIPLAYYSRLVVNKEYQNNGISRSIDEFVINLCTKAKMKWIIGLSSLRTDLMINTLGFKKYGKIHIRYHERSRPHLVNVIIRKTGSNRSQRSSNSKQGPDPKMSHRE